MRYAIALSLLLAGCAPAPLTPQERADQFDAYITNLMETFGPACDRAYPHGSEQWGRCVVMLAEKDERQRERRDARSMEMLYLWNATRPRQTNCQNIGGRVSCTSY